MLVLGCGFYDSVPEIILLHDSQQISLTFLHFVVSMQCLGNLNLCR